MSALKKRAQIKPEELDLESTLSRKNKVEAMKASEDLSDAAGEQPSFISEKVPSDSEDDAIQANEVFNPYEMSSILDKFYTFVENESAGNKTNATQVMKTLAEKFTKNNKEVPLQKFLRSYHIYVKKIGTRRPLETDKDVLQFGLTSIPDMVKLYPGFPRETPSLAKFYAQKHGLAFGFGKIEEVKRRMNEDEYGRRKAEMELAELEESTLKNLKAFLETHNSSLSAVQKKYVVHKINLLNKKIHPSDVEVPRRKKPKYAEEKPDSVKPKSVFELFVRTMGDKYNHLDPEKKDRKLKKKFEQLSEQELEIYNKCYYNS